MKHLISEKTKSMLTPKNIGLYILGNAFISLGPVIASASGLGACGYDAYNFRLAEILHVNTSVVVYMSAFICLVIGAVIRKSHLHFSTFIASLICGVGFDLWQTVFANLAPESVIARCITFVLGMSASAFGIALCMTSGLPNNPTDDLVVAMRERNIGITRAKMTVDITACVLAFLIHASIGIGTVILMFCLGPAVNLAYKFINNVLLRSSNVNVLQQQD